MTHKARNWTIGIAAFLLVGYLAFRLIAPPLIEKGLNKNLAYTPVTVTDSTRSFHDSLVIMDWHADTLLWNRDFLARSDYGQVDLPRLETGGFNLQMMTVVTKSPSGQNYTSNSGSSGDNITSLAIAQGWPFRTWGSLLERALFQAHKLENYVAVSRGSLRFIRSKEDLTLHMGKDDTVVGTLLGLEGAHPLEGKLENIDLLYDAGFRMIGLTHFFDNELSGSLHGIEKKGLSDFGKAAVARLDALGIIIDLSHASEAAAYEVLQLSSRAPVVSHTGFKGHCDTPRNFNDDLMKAVAAKGGLISVGFWDAAVCDPTPEGIAEAIKYGIDLVGAEHVALGSDWDGSVEAISADALPQITQALIDRQVSETDIRKVMGENSVRFLQAWLPNAATS